jgi:hypothetical protein
MFLLLCLLSSVAAETYSRVYLRGVQQKQLIHSVFMAIEGAVLQAANQGLTQVTSPPFSCEAVDRSRRYIRLPPHLNKEKCELIVRTLRSAVSRQFPDSDLTYDEATQQYTLSWA